MARRGLLCLLFLVTLASPQHPIVDADLDHEVWVVARSGRRDHVVNRPNAQRGLGKLLKVRFGVGDRVIAPELLQVGRQQASDKRPRRRQSLVEIEGADDGFESLGEKPSSRAPTSLDFAPAEKEQIAQTESTGNPAKGLGADQMGAHRAELAFGCIGILVVEVLGDDQPDDRVAQILQPLVRSEVEVWIFVQVGAMNERLLEKDRFVEVNAKDSLSAADDVDRGPRLFFPGPDDQRRVVPTEAQRVGECHANRMLTRDVWDVVEIAVRVRVF